MLFGGDRTFSTATRLITSNHGRSSKKGERFCSSFSLDVDLRVPRVSRNDARIVADNRAGLENARLFDKLGQALGHGSSHRNGD